MGEKERLEKEVLRLRIELKELNMKYALGKINDENIIKEKKRELVKVLTSLELCMMQQRTYSKGR